jgi:hypothetical protein
MSSPAGWSTSSLSKAPEPERASHTAALKSSPRLTAPLSRIWRGDYAAPLYRRAIGLLLSTFVVFAAACGGGDDDNGIAISTQAPARALTPETRTPIGVPPVQPTTPAVQPVGGGEAVAFQSADGAVTMRGNLFAAPGPKRKAVVIAYVDAGGANDWAAVARDLAGTGVAALAYQLPPYKDFPSGTRDPVLVDKDVETAVSFLESRDYPLIYLMTEGTATVGAIKVAAHHKVAGVITVTGFTSMGSVNVTADLPKVTAPKLFITGQDSRSPTALQELMRGAVEPKQSRVFTGGPTGVQLFSGPDGAAAKQLVRDFLLK